MLAHDSQPLPPAILIVDDDPAMRKILRDVLEFGEYRVALAANAHEALELLHMSSPNPQLIITDIMMPNMDGYEFLQAVRAETKWKDVPFLIISGQGAATRSEGQIQATGVSYLPKPFLVPTLFETVTKAISQAVVQ